jgi:pimeloyl-ACP methyl ester carboxylesterase
VRRLALTSFGIAGDVLTRALLARAQAAAAFTLGLWYPWLSITAPLRDLARPLVRELVYAPPLPQLMAAWFLDQAPASPFLIREGLADLAGMDLRAHLACLASVGDPAIVAALPRISTPALLVTGRQDRVMPPEMMGAAARLIPGAATLTLERCGHLPMHEQPQTYHDALRAFLV